MKEDNMMATMSGKSQIWPHIGKGENAAGWRENHPGV